MADEEESGNSGFSCDDLLVKILSLLPTKTLFKFKSVCKTWLFTISTILFQRTISFQSRLSGLFFQSVLYSDGFSYLPLLKGVGAEDSIIDADLNFLPHRSKSIILDSRNGFLLCCPEMDQSTCYPSEHGRRHRIPASTYYICNPVTRQWIILPKLRRRFRPKFDYGRSYAALVFDSLHPSSHYKVIRLNTWHSCLHNESPTTFLRFDIFSSEMGRWTRSKASCHGATRYLLCRPPVFLNGAMYFLSNEEHVIRFHVNEGHCQVIALPGGIQTTPGYPNVDWMGVSEGRLKYVCAMGGLVQVWSLDDDNVRKWELKHRIEFRSIDCMDRPPSPYIIWALHPYSDAIVLWNKGKVFFLHFPSKRLEMVYETDGHKFLVRPFSESLFSLEEKKVESGVCRGGSKAL